MVCVEGSAGGVALFITPFSHVLISGLLIENVIFIGKLDP